MPKPWVTALVVGATLACVVLVVFLAIADLYAPRASAGVFRDVALGQIIARLENNNVIPRGTTWADTSLRERRVSVAWLWPTDREALAAIAREANVEIEYPMGHHGDIWGPISIRNASGPPGLVPRRATGEFRGLKSPCA